MYMRMKRLFILAIAALALAACSPNVYMMSLESRSPSLAGLDLAGKSMAVIYLESPDGCDSLFNNRVADALAYTLEQDYFDGEEAVGVYNLVKDPDGDYATRDTASQYVMLLDSDVVMIIDTPETAQVNSQGLLPTVNRVYVYDSLGGEVDDISSLSCTAYPKSLTDASKAVNVGASLGASLVSQWKEEVFNVLYFEDALGGPWVKAISKAEQMQWPDAMIIWMDLVMNKNNIKASAARYNLALGCYVMEQYDLALEWLDSSDKLYPISISKSLRTLINQKAKAAISD